MSGQGNQGKQSSTSQDGRRRSGEGFGLGSGMESGSGSSMGSGGSRGAGGTGGSAGNR